MKVPMLNPIEGNKEFQGELEEAALRVLRSGKFILGEEVEEFEAACCDLIGCKYAIGVSSGSDALIASLMALGVGPGDEVICPSFTFFATAGAIERVGATPIFCDINRLTFNLDYSRLESLISIRTSAVIPVHLFGQCANMNNIKEITDNYGLPIIEDACQSIGSTYDGKQAGTMGDLGCFSFFPSKNLGGFGDGGLVTTNDRELYNKIIMLRNHGASNRYYHDIVGGNFRIDALQAALLKVKLQYLPDIQDKRQKHAEIYDSKLPRNFWKPYRDDKATHVFNQYTVRVENRDELQTYLGGKGIGSAVYYPLPLHKQKCFSTTSYLPATDGAANDVLSIPIAAELTDEQIHFVADTMNEWE